MNLRWSERDERPPDGLSPLNLRSNSDCIRRVVSTSDVRDGSWPCKNRLRGTRVMGPGPGVTQATIAAMSGLMPTMFMTRVRL
jgi:hypothetical protein